MLRAVVEDGVDVLLREGSRFLAGRVAQGAVDAVLEKLVDLLGVLLRLAGAKAALSAAQHSLVQAVLLRGRLEERLLVRRLGDEAVHLDLLRLADAVTARHGLQVVLRVPIGVVDYGGVCGGERDTHATCSGRQEVHEALARGVESIDARLSISLRRAAVQTLVFVSHEVEVVAEDVEDDGELREDENLVPLSLELREELVQEHHFTAGLRDHIQRLWWRRWGRGFESLLDRFLRSLLCGELDGALLLVCEILLHPVAQKRVVANLSKFHAQVTKLRHVLALVPLHQDVHLLLVDHAVVRALLRGELDPDDDLLLGRNLLDVLLHAAEHAGLEHLTQPHDLLGVHLPAAAVEHALLEVLPARVLLRVEDVHDAEEFLDVVLDRGSREQEKPVVANLHDGFGGERVDVLELVSLVADARGPLERRDELREPACGLEGHQKDVELCRALSGCLSREPKLGRFDDLTILRVAVHENDVHVRPLLDLALPVPQGGQRRDDEERPRRAELLGPDVLHD
mmetsp:Transcript_9174/g.41610  ORF Transcript_9174/g.41610 Transcript_9174/m.41610 type:complete len:513 (+) Transcript_9174:2353-3891(+)